MKQSPQGQKLFLNLALSPEVDDRICSQVAWDVYFVIVVAYDYNDYAHGVQHALWGTKMTVSAMGVAMFESLPPLIATAAPYFGREMTQAATLLQTIHRDGKVAIGPLHVVGEEPAPAAAKEKK